MDVGIKYSADELDALSELRQYFPPGTSEDEILHIYRDPELFKQFIDELQSHYSDMQESYSVYNECIVPVLQQGWESMWLLLLYCLVLRSLSIAKAPKIVLHSASIIFGCLSLWKFYGGLMMYVLLPVFFIVTITKFRRIPGLWLAVVAGIYMIAGEFFLLSSMDWNKIKGSVMILLMKIISVAFDEESNLIQGLSLIEHYGYLLNPASLMFGPFINYEHYQQIYMRHSISFSWFSNCCRAVLLSFGCLVWSSCGTTNYLTKLDAYVPVLKENRWWQAYREAQQFRFSHYFISYISEATCLLMGIGTIVPMATTTVSTAKSHVETSRNKNYSKHTPHRKDCKNNEEKVETEFSWKVPVANILQVEMPRSLVDVVTNWNLPMHYWLKTYIFKSTRKFGVFPAILLTYLASSMLHSLNFQLSAVLLSIGVFAYVESVFRHALATVFSACIEARRCRKDCNHKYKQWNFWVIAVNLLFVMIAIWNLAYLGCLFDNSEEEEKGYSMGHTLRKWQQFQYANHAFMFGLLVLQKFMNAVIRQGLHA